MIMSNLSYVMSEVIPRLFDCFVTHGYPECPEVEDVSVAWSVAGGPHGMLVCLGD